MSTFGEEVIKIRRYLRDPAHNIWDNDMLMEFWNETQHDIQNKTSILEDVRAISVPPAFEWAYLHDWEAGHVQETSSRYRALRQQQNFYAVCFWWEIQEKFGQEADIADDGSQATYPFEWYTSLGPGTLPVFPFPHNFAEAKAVYYDLEPITGATAKEVNSQDPSWNTREGEPLHYIRREVSSNNFFLYPRPSTIVWNDEDGGTGLVTSVSGDTTDDDLGIITQRTGNLLSAELGGAIQVLDADDNVVLIYEITPREITGLGEAIDFPVWMHKYVRYGVLFRAFLANTDGRIKSLAQYWRRRYELGLQVIEKHKNKRKKDRDYRLRTSDVPPRRLKRHPRLPDGYPAVNP